MPECKRESWREKVYTKRENNLRNHGFILSLGKGKITLDNPRGFTYHTRACAKGLTSNTRTVHAGNRLNRGADSHDE
jgi:hypothetical protein